MSVMKRPFTRGVSWNQPQPVSLPPPPLPPLQWGGAADRWRSASNNRTDIMWKYRTMSLFSRRMHHAGLQLCDRSRRFDWSQIGSTRARSHTHAHAHPVDMQIHSGVIQTSCVALVLCPPTHYPLRQQPAERPLELGHDTGGSAN